MNTLTAVHQGATICLAFPDETITEVTNRAWDSAGGNAKGRVNGIQASTGIQQALQQLQPVVPMPGDNWYIQAFRNFDSDRDGYISYEAFWQIIKQYHDHHAARNARHYNQHIQAMQNSNSQSHNFRPFELPVRSSPSSSPSSPFRPSTSSPVRDLLSLPSLFIPTAIPSTTVGTRTSIGHRFSLSDQSQKSSIITSPLFSNNPSLLTSHPHFLHSPSRRIPSPQRLQDSESFFAVSPRSSFGSSLLTPPSSPSRFSRVRRSLEPPGPYEEEEDHGKLNDQGQHQHVGDANCDSDSLKSSSISLANDRVTTSSANTDHARFSIDPRMRSLSLSSLGSPSTSSSSSSNSDTSQQVHSPSLHLQRTRLPALSNKSPDNEQHSSADHEHFGLYTPTRPVRLERLLQNSKPTDLTLCLDKVQRASTVTNSPSRLKSPRLWSNARAAHRFRASTSHRCPMTSGRTTQPAHDTGRSNSTRTQSSSHRLPTSARHHQLGSSSFRQYQCCSTRSSWVQWNDHDISAIVLSARGSSCGSTAAPQRHSSHYYNDHRHHHDISLPAAPVPSFSVVAHHTAPSPGEWIGLADTGGPQDFRSDGEGGRARRNNKGLGGRWGSDGTHHHNKDNVHNNQEPTSHSAPCSGTQTQKPDKKGISRFKQQLLKRIVKDGRARNSTGGAPASYDDDNNNDGWRLESLPTLELFDHVGDDYFDQRGFTFPNRTRLPSPEKSSMRFLQRARSHSSIEDDFVPSPDAKPPPLPLVLPPAPVYGYYDPATGQLFHPAAASAVKPAGLHPISSIPAHAARPFPVLLMNPVTGTTATAGSLHYGASPAGLTSFHPTLPIQQQSPPQEPTKNTTPLACCRGCNTMVAEEKQTEISFHHQQQSSKGGLDAPPPYPTASTDMGTPRSVGTVSDYEVPSEHPANEPPDSRHHRRLSAGIQRRQPGFISPIHQSSNLFADNQSPPMTVTPLSPAIQSRKYSDGVAGILPDASPLRRGSRFPVKRLLSAVVADGILDNYSIQDGSNDEAKPSVKCGASVKALPSSSLYSWMSCCGASPSALQVEELTVSLPGKKLSTNDNCGDQGRSSNNRQLLSRALTRRPTRHYLKRGSTTIGIEQELVSALGGSSAKTARRRSARSSNRSIAVDASIVELTS